MKPSHTVEMKLKELLHSKKFNKFDKIHLQLIFNLGDTIISFKDYPQNILKIPALQKYLNNSYIHATGLLPMYHDGVHQRDIYIIQFMVE